MKRLVLNTLLIALTVTVSAQTSRRQGSHTVDTRKENRVKSNTNRLQQNTRSTTSDRNRSTEKRVAYNQVDNNRNSNNPNINYKSKHSNNYKTERRVPENNRRKNSQHTVKRENNHTNHTYHSYHKTPRTNVRYKKVSPSHHVHVNRNLYVRRPPRVNVVWDVRLYRDYCSIYPHVKTWNVRYGSPIYSVPAYEASYYVGDVKRVYGYVSEVYYDRNTDDYHLYIGGRYPYHDFTTIVPGYLARQISSRPYRYFSGSYISTTGLISHFNGQPEMVVKRMHQIQLF